MKIKKKWKFFLWSFAALSVIVPITTITAIACSNHPQSEIGLITNDEDYRISQGLGNNNINDLFANKYAVSYKNNILNLDVMKKLKAIYATSLFDNPFNPDPWRFGYLTEKTVQMAQSMEGIILPARPYKFEDLYNVFIKNAPNLKHLYVFNPYVYDEAIQYGLKDMLVIIDSPKDLGF